MPHCVNKNDSLVSRLFDLIQLRATWDDFGGVESRLKIGYNSRMTDELISEIDLLGSPLPGAVWLPHYRVGIGKRGAQEVLEWRVAQSSAPPHALGDSPFVSLPRPVPAAMMKRGRQRRRSV